MAAYDIPIAPAAAFPSAFLVAFIFNYILYRYKHLWWEKYAYLFSLALSAGGAISGFIIFIILKQNHIHFPEWWGTGGPTGDGCLLSIANYSGFIQSERDL